MEACARTSVEKDRKWVSAFTGRSTELSKLPPLVDNKVDGRYNIPSGSLHDERQVRYTLILEQR